MAALLRTIIIDSDDTSRANLRGILAGTPAVLVGEFSNISEALRTAAAYRPDVLIVEVPIDQGKNSDGAAAKIEHLARVLPDASIVVTGPTQSAQLVIQVMRAGAADYVARPVKPEDLRAAVEKVVRSRPALGAEQRSGRVISVFSAKGGAGVTTVATNLSVCCAKQSSGRAVLVDLDARQADVATFLNLRPQYSVVDAFENIGRMDEAFLKRLLTECANGLWVLPGPAAMNRVKLRPEQVQAGIEILRTYFDRAILDLPHDTDEPTVAALEVSDIVFFLVRQNVSALRLGAAAVKTFRRFGIDLKKLRLVVVGERSREDVTFKQIREMFEMPVHWKIPSDEEAVVSAINHGEPLVTGLPRSRIAKSLRQLSETLIDHHSAEAADKRAGALMRFCWNLGLFSQGIK